MGQSTMIDVVNPSTLAVVESVPATEVGNLDRMIDDASASQRAWSQLNHAERGKHLDAAADEVESAAEEIASLLTAEQGKPIAEARMEVVYVLRALRHFATLQEDEPWRDEATRRTRVLREPLGVVGAIVPWNWPVSLLTWKVGPAVMAGNAVIVKPAPTTPLSSLALVAALNRALPADLVQVVLGGADLGSAMVSHPGLAKISFTGSTPTGKAIMGAGAGTLKRLTLELGGNDAAIILPDAKPDEVLGSIYASAFNNAGQTCVAVKRLYVPAAMERQVVDRLLDMASSAVVGDGMDPHTRMGPLHLRSQRDKVQSMIDEARDRGAEARAPGHAMEDRPGWFLRPTIVTGAPDEAQIVAEEQFGPALPVLTYGHVDDAIVRANAVDFDLGASVWGDDVEQATEVAFQLRAGSVWVNQHAAFDLSLPFGGLQHSGLGHELGPRALEQYSACKVVNVRV